ncbi:hypothetical protein C7974DRAFT_408885 [Boeremia exigua]|uniref:uncharacterized protein n=1 Tax=Boeremia exigua TaxID=749465 RepID=UPI001E8D64FA|nr:uncharacterized protein C7974DRAFT_408885 [Boeremia exigua]KAH6642319.1 hypothetical protein C7974DRAFT_408885 [Boeremia exigua]
MSHGRYSPTTRLAFSHIAISRSASSSERASHRRSSRKSKTAKVTSQPSTGVLSHQQHISKPSQRAERRLCTSRLKLQRYLTSHDWRAEKLRRLPTDAQLRSLGVLDAEGAVLARPRESPGTWRSEARMREKRKLRGRSRLTEVCVNLSERGLDEEYGVLPGEEWVGEGEVSEETKMKLIVGCLEDEGCKEALMAGQRAEGVWRNVVGGGGGDNESVVRWVCEEREMEERRVMDPCCMEVVRKVMNGEST